MWGALAWSNPSGRKPSTEMMTTWSGMGSGVRVEGGGGWVAVAGAMGVTEGAEVSIGLGVCVGASITRSTGVGVVLAIEQAVQNTNTANITSFLRIT